MTYDENICIKINEKIVSTKDTLLNCVYLLLLMVLLGKCGFICMQNMYSYSCI